MTDDGDDTLPDTDDPHALLGVAADADERTIKRAYARLIKRWRPDRAPEEFRRIHAAYEALLDRRTRLARATTEAQHADAESGAPAIAPDVAPRPASSGSPRPPTREPVEDLALDRRAAEVAEALVAARARSDFGLVDKLLMDACAEGIPIGAIFEYTTPEHHPSLANSPALTWRRISAHGGPGYIAETLMTVLSVSTRLQFQIRTNAILQDPGLIKAASADPALAAVCLRAIAAQAWQLRPPGPAALRSYYRTLPDDPAVEALAARVDREIDTGARCVVSGIGLPVPLFEYFSLASMVPRPVLLHLTSLLAESVARYAERYLRAFDRAFSIPGLESRLIEQLQVATLGGADAPTPGHASATMARMLRARSGRLAPRVAIGFFTVAACAVIALPPVSFPELCVLPAGALVTTLAGLEVSRYERVRRELAEVMLSSGVSMADIVRWLDDNRSLRLGRFAKRARHDRGLALFGHLAVMVAAHEIER